MCDFITICIVLPYYYLVCDHIICHSTSSDPIWCIWNSTTIDDKTGVNIRKYMGDRPEQWWYTCYSYHYELYLFKYVPVAYGKFMKYEHILYYMEY